MIADIISANNSVFRYVGVFPVGCYAYPFSHQLPHSLPGEVLGQSLTVYLALLSPWH